MTTSSAAYQAGQTVGQMFAISLIVAIIVLTLGIVCAMVYGIVRLVSRTQGRRRIPGPPAGNR
jgi:ABC-type amino acid transport system permease subunit